MSLDLSQCSDRDLVALARASQQLAYRELLRRFDRFTAADADLRERRYAFHIGQEPPRVSRYIAEPLGQ